MRNLLLGPDITVTSDASDVLQVRGLTAEQIGLAAWQARLPGLRTDHPARLAGGGLHAADRRLGRLPFARARGLDAHDVAETAVAR